MSKTAQTSTDTALIAKLKAYRASREGDHTFTLPETGVVTTFPKFRRHGDWVRASRMGKNDLTKAQAIYVCMVVKFDGESLTQADLEAYIPMSDANALLAELFGGDEEDDDEMPGKTLN